MKPGSWYSSPCLSICSTEQCASTELSRITASTKQAACINWCCPENYYNIMPQAKPAINILIIDDDEDDFFITSDYMRQISEYNLAIDWCYRFNDAIEQLNARKYDMYFVDYRLGAKTGLDF